MVIVLTDNEVEAVKASLKARLAVSTGRIDWGRDTVRMDYTFVKGRRSKPYAKKKVTDGARYRTR